MKNPNCIVVFPVYKSLNVVELSCLKQAMEMTKGFEKVFVTSESLVLDDSFDDLKFLDTVRFSNQFFSSVEGYNRLMLSLEFYEQFKKYEYVLIHQTDAYLFKDELGFWCARGYDYIGAPWLNPSQLFDQGWNLFLGNILPFLFDEYTVFLYLSANNVGNGGLFLRRTNTFINVLNMTPPHILDKYMNRVYSTMYNEDVFWAIEAPKICNRFYKPFWDEALFFSVEMSPELACKMMNDVPFGCHGFNVHGPDFWKNYIPVLNENCR